MHDRRDMYVSVLFEELAFLEVPQKEVAQHLGVSESMVSKWATGAIPISMRRADNFLTFVKEAEQKAIEQAKAQPRSAQRSTVLTGAVPHTPEEKLEEKLREFFCRWVVEIEDRNGEIYEDLATQCRALAPYGHMEKDKLRELLNTSPEARRARAAIVKAAKSVLQEMNRLERMKPVEEGH
jgi:predicted transcriptional regulator